MEVWSRWKCSRYWILVPWQMRYVSSLLWWGIILNQNWVSSVHRSMWSTGLLYTLVELDRCQYNSWSWLALTILWLFSERRVVTAAGWRILPNGRICLSCKTMEGSSHQLLMRTSWVISVTLLSGNRRLLYLSQWRSNKICALWTLSLSSIRKAT